MKAMILCAGRGERMRPLTDSLPKPLLPVGGRPLVVWTIERLARAGITELVINHAHLGKQIERALGDGGRFGASIRYSPEAAALETAGGIANALPWLGDAPFLVVNGDIYCDLDYARFIVAGLPEDALARIVLVDNPTQHPSGDFALAGDRVVNDGDRRLTFAGIGLYRPALFAPVARQTEAKLAPLLRQAADRGELRGEHFVGRWLDVGTPERLAALDRALRDHAA